MLIYEALLFFAATGKVLGLAGNSSLTVIYNKVRYIIMFIIHTFLPNEIGRLHIRPSILTKYIKKY